MALIETLHPKKGDGNNCTRMNPGSRSPSTQSEYTAPAEIVDETISVVVTGHDCEEKIEQSHKVSIQGFVETSSPIPPSATSVPIQTATATSAPAQIPTATEVPAPIATATLQPDTGAAMPEIAQNQTVEGRIEEAGAEHQYKLVIEEEGTYSFCRPNPGLGRQLAWGLYDVNDTLIRKANMGSSMQGLGPLKPGVFTIKIWRGGITWEGPYEYSFTYRRKNSC